MAAFRRTSKRRMPRPKLRNANTENFRDEKHPAAWTGSGVFSFHGTTSASPASATRRTAPRVGGHRAWFREDERVGTTDAEVVAHLAGHSLEELASALLRWAGQTQALAAWCAEHEGTRGEDTSDALIGAVEKTFIRSTPPGVRDAVGWLTHATGPASRCRYGAKNNQGPCFSTSPYSDPIAPRRRWGNERSPCRVRGPGTGG